MPTPNLREHAGTWNRPLFEWPPMQSAADFEPTGDEFRALDGLTASPIEGTTAWTMRPALRKTGTGRTCVRRSTGVGRVRATS
jgi:hypothetical protein